MKIEDLIKDAYSQKYLDNMCNSVDILGQHLMKNDTIITEVQRRYLCILCAYISSFAIYIREIAKSYTTLDFLSINAIGRSAVECYSIAKFIYLNYHRDTNKLFQLLIASDLRETQNIIKKYNDQINTGIDLNVQLENNKKIFSDEINIFPDAKKIFDEKTDYKVALKEITKTLQQDKFAENVCTGEGYLSITKLVSKMLETNDFFQIVYCSKIEANVFYDLMCSPAHNNYHDIMKLFSVPNTNEFKVGLYPQFDEKYNKLSILKMLYVNYIDLLNCLDEINICIKLTNENEYQIFYPSKKYTE